MTILGELVLVMLAFGDGSDDVLCEYCLGFQMNIISTASVPPKKSLICKKCLPQKESSLY